MYLLFEVKRYSSAKIFLTTQFLILYLSIWSKVLWWETFNEGIDGAKSVREVGGYGGNDNRQYSG